MMTVKDSWEELNWLFGEHWCKFEKPRKGENSLVFSLSKRLGNFFSTENRQH